MIPGHVYQYMDSCPIRTGPYGNLSNIDKDDKVVCVEIIDDGDFMIITAIDGYSTIIDSEEATHFKDITGV